MQCFRSHSLLDSLTPGWFCAEENLKKKRKKVSIWGPACGDASGFVPLEGMWTHINVFHGTVKQMITLSHSPRFFQCGFVVRNVEVMKPWRFSSGWSSSPIISELPLQSPHLSVSFSCISPPREREKERARNREREGKKGDLTETNLYHCHFVMVD